MNEPTPEAKSIDDIATQLTLMSNNHKVDANRTTGTVAISHLAKAQGLHDAAEILRQTLIVKPFKHDERLLATLADEFMDCASGDCASGDNLKDGFIEECVKGIMKTYALQMLRKTS